MRLLVAVALCGLLGACRTDMDTRNRFIDNPYARGAHADPADPGAPPEAREAPPPATQGPAFDPATFNAKQYATAFATAAECEQGARRIKPQSADAAWELLKVCMQRKDFTLIRRLTDGTWDEELQTRKEAPVFLTKVMAQRGGDVADVTALTQRRVPVFSLAAAMAQPSVYRGRLVIVRAKVSDFKAQGKKFTAMLDETSVGSASLDVARPRAGWAYESGSHSSSDTFVTYEKRHEQEAVETGLSAVARIPKADPFMQPGKEFLFLATFDGVRRTDEDEGDEFNEARASKTAVLTIQAYYAPASLLLE